jgi:translation initiation factor 2 subunit 1
MIIQKELPSTGELVLVKITKIMQHGAYCTLVEYNIDAYLPISEVSTGWIKNIHEFIKEGQSAVAKVIAVDKPKKSIDVSLKKATLKERTVKMNDYNTEKRSEKLFEQALTDSKLETQKEKIINEISEHTRTYTELIFGISENKNYADFIKNEKLKEALLDIVSKNIKPKRYIVSYIMELRSASAKSGIDMIKKILAEISSTGTEILYLGAPKYKLTSEDSSYPKAESKIKETQKILEKYSKQIEFSIKGA